jgi:hypothetical protein
MYEHVPSALTTLPQWVWVKNDSKVPLCSSDKLPASVSNPQTWNDFHTACLDGGNPGFVFNDNGIVGIDIDEGVIDEDDFPTPFAAQIIKLCDSYTERSRSGRGIHIFVKGDIPFHGKNNLRGMEMYKSKRYFIVTGRRMYGKGITENQTALDKLVSTYFPEIRREKDHGFGSRIYSPTWHLPSNGRIMVKPQYPPIKPGGRNLSLTSLAGSMHNTGYSFDEIFKELLFVNETQCRPPLDTHEVLTIVKSITRYRR